MAAAFVGGRVGRFIPAGFLLAAFAVLMLVMAWAMLRGRGEMEATREAGPVARVALQGAAVGFMTGLVGAGGGFIVVPALVLLVGLPMREAVATSLLVIALNSFAGLLGSLGHVSLDWRLTAVVTGAAVAGAMAGTAVSGRVPQATLRRMFAWLVLAMGGYMLWRQLPPTALSSMHDFLRTHSWWVHASKAGALIGLAAAGLLLLHRKVGPRISAFPYRPIFSTVAALSTKAKGIPEQVRNAIREAHAAGVPIYVCEAALANAGIEDVMPGAQRVPQGAAKIAELVSEGFVPMQY